MIRFLSNSIAMGAVENKNENGILGNDCGIYQDGTTQENCQRFGFQTLGERITGELQLHRGWWQHCEDGL